MLVSCADSTCIAAQIRLCLDFAWVSSSHTCVTSGALRFIFLFQFNRFNTFSCIWFKWLNCFNWLSWFNGLNRCNWRIRCIRTHRLNWFSRITWFFAYMDASVVHLAFWLSVFKWSRYFFIWRLVVNICHWIIFNCCLFRCPQFALWVLIVCRLLTDLQQFLLNFTVGPVIDFVRVLNWLVYHFHTMRQIQILEQGRMHH